MNPTLLIGLCIAGLAGATVYVAWRQVRPRHVFIARDLNLGTAQPYRLKTLTGQFKMKRRDGKQVIFPIPEGFAQPRIDGKGIMVEGDLNTGQLLKPAKMGKFLASHGVFLSAALGDGRIDTLVRSTKGSGLTLKHVMIGLAIVGGLVIIVIYQFAKGHGSA